METFIDWRRADPAFQAEVERVVAECALRRLRKIEKHGEENFAACCWLLERRHPELFGRPEIQLNMIQQNNTVENSLTINITGAEAAAIERQTQPIRERVAEMMRAYRPLQPGNGDAGVREIDASPVPEPKQEQPPITHCESDVQNPLFWKTLVTSNPESLVAKETAVFASELCCCKRWATKHTAHRSILLMTPSRWATCSTCLKSWVDLAAGSLHKSWADTDR